jgi:hypothetical protein
MHFRKLAAAGAAATLLFSAGAADAALVFVGSWRLNAGPANPAPASAQQVAAKLFGGDPVDYFISTAGENVGAINELAFYGVIGSPGSVVIDGHASTSFSGQDISAYVGDASIEDRFVNYAFKDDPTVGVVPEPSAWGLLIVGFGVAGAALRGRRRIAAT